MKLGDNDKCVIMSVDTPSEDGEVDPLFLSETKDVKLLAPLAELFLKTTNILWLSNEMLGSFPLSIPVNSAL